MLDEEHGEKINRNKNYANITPVATFVILSSVPFSEECGLNSSILINVVYNSKK